MTPKSLLRHKLATSSLKDLTQGGFQTLIPEIDELDRGQVTRMILCSGKVYYDLLEKRREAGLKDVAIIRIEQLYPFPVQELKAQLNAFPILDKVIWCQEEPLNQGAWYSTQHNIRALLDKGHYLEHVTRPPSAAPAVGYFSMHVQQQKALVAEALGLDE